jgi:hypothetical protein
MKRISKNFIAEFLLAATLLLLPTYVQTQPTAVSQTGQELLKEKSRRLSQLLETIKSLEQELASQKDINSHQNVLDDHKSKHLQELSSRLKMMQLTFDEVLTEIARDQEPSAGNVNKSDWTQEAKDILSPLVSEMRRLTARPRELDRLRTDLEQKHHWLELSKKAVANIEAIKSAGVAADIVEEARRSEDFWLRRAQDLGAEISLIEQRLESKLAEKKSLSESIDSLVEIFFKSRGRNLVLACAAALIVWFLARLVLRRLDQLSIVRSNRLISVKLFNVLYRMLAGLCALVVAMLVLYAFGDWLLIILAVFLLVGVAWASKQAVPRLWKQLMLVLNMGAVREGERVRYCGVPWLVKHLNFYSELWNPELSPETIRLPINNLSEVCSRDYSPQEPWFPTSVGDWVEFQDGILAQVSLQSVDQVVLTEVGGSKRCYQTSEYLELEIVNLSSGFRVNQKFGLDYSLQSIIFSDIVPSFKQAMENALRDELSKGWLLSLNVDFSAASASSLDMVILADFSGEAAGQFAQLKRKISSACLILCTERGWKIPFPQLQVHTSN